MDTRTRRFHYREPRRSPSPSRDDLLGRRAVGRRLGSGWRAANRRPSSGQLPATFLQFDSRIQAFLRRFRPEPRNAPGNPSWLASICRKVASASSPQLFFSSIRESRRFSAAFAPSRETPRETPVGSHRSAGKLHRRRHTRGSRCRARPRKLHPPCQARFAGQHERSLWYGGRVSHMTSSTIS